MSAAPIHVETPLWESAPMSDALGARVLLKMEAFQPVGSFKARGIGAACAASRESGAARLVCASGGNAGYAVAYAGRKLGVETIIVVPSATPPSLREMLRGEGAEVRVHGDAWDESHQYALSLAEREDTAYIHPFDDPRVWEGHATMMAEIAAAGVAPGAVVFSVGGGGLLCGVLLGLQRAGLEDVPALAVETQGAASFAAAVSAGRAVTLERIDTVATTLGSRRVTEEALAWAARREVTPWVVSDRAAVEACRRFADEHRVLVEPACGATLSAVYGRAAPLQGRDPVVVIVCGGAGVSIGLLEQWARRLDEAPHDGADPRGAT